MNIVKNLMMIGLIFLGTLFFYGVSFGQTTGNSAKRKTYALEPGGRYVMNAIVYTKDGRRKRVTLVVRVPKGKKQPNLVAPAVGNQLPSVVPNAIESIDNTQNNREEQELLNIQPEAGIPSMPGNGSETNLGAGLPNVY